MEKSKKLEKRTISIVCPLFNEEDNIEELYEELIEVIKKLKFFNFYEIIMVNDGSTDNSLKILKSIAKKDKNFKITSFTTEAKNVRGRSSRRSFSCVSLSIASRRQGAREEESFSEHLL